MYNNHFAHKLISSPFVKVIAQAMGYCTTDVRNTQTRSFRNVYGGMLIKTEIVWPSACIRSGSGYKEFFECELTGERKLRTMGLSFDRACCFCVCIHLKFHISKEHRTIDLFDRFHYLHFTIHLEMHFRFPKVSVGFIAIGILRCWLQQLFEESSF